MAIEALLVDIVRGVCELAIDTGVQLIEDVVDCLASWRMPPFHARHLQRVVLQVATNAA